MITFLQKDRQWCNRWCILDRFANSRRRWTCLWFRWCRTRRGPCFRHWGQWREVDSAPFCPTSIDHKLPACRSSITPETKAGKVKTSYKAKDITRSFLKRCVSRTMLKAGISEFNHRHSNELGNKPERANKQSGSAFWASERTSKWPVTHDSRGSASQQVVHEEYRTGHWTPCRPQWFRTSWNRVMNHSLISSLAHSLAPRCLAALTHSKARGTVGGISIFWSKC